MSRPSVSRAALVGSLPIGVSTASAVPFTRSNTHLSTRLFSPKPGHRKRPSSSRRNQLTKKILGRFAGSVAFSMLQPVGEVVGHVVAAERQHRHGVEAQLADGALRGGGGLRRHDRAEEHAVLPVVGLGDERHGGARGGRRTGSPRSARRRGPPTRERSTGTARPGAVKRAFGWAAGVSISGFQSLPFQSVARAGAVSVMPSHHTSPSSVSAVLVKMQLPHEGLHGVGVGVPAGARGDAEEAGLGVDGVEPAVVAELHPADVVADGLGLPAGNRGDEHGEVGLAARRRERGGDVLRLALGGRELQDQHVLGEPAVVAGHHRGDAQREALLAEQGVAAVAGAVRPDLAGLGEVHDVLVLGVARPRHVGLRRRRAGRRRSAGTAPSRRRRARRARPGPCGS